MRIRFSIALILLLLGTIHSGAQTSAPTTKSTSDESAANQEQPKDHNGGVEILSDTQGVDFGPYLKRWYWMTNKTWDKLMPEEVNKPTLRKGAVQIRFKILPNGKVTNMKLEGRSGTDSLDRAAWGAITDSSYPPLPNDFHGPNLELRVIFLYNEQPPK